MRIDVIFSNNFRHVHLFQAIKNLALREVERILYFNYLHFELS
nr:MAG TPA: hypothetical protein [Caudoviricetes sp.]